VKKKEKLFVQSKAKKVDDKVVQEKRSSTEMNRKLEIQELIL
jgi:hypothetical protein